MNSLSSQSQTGHKILTFGIADWCFIFAAFLYQIIFVFQGLDFADEGFFAVFYQQIFNDPQSVAFNFMYWLSGIIGGSFYQLFPGSGLLSIRLLGVIVTTITLIISYYSLKKHISTSSLRIGLFLILLFMNNDPKELNYDNLTNLLLVLAAIFIFHGLKRDKFYYFLISGGMISLCMFSRTPSITGLILLVGILYYNLTTNKKNSIVIKQSIIFLLGFVAMTALVFLIMKIIGHFAIYINNLKIVFGMGFSKYGSNDVFMLTKNLIHSLSISIILALSAMTIMIIVNSFLDSAKLQKIDNRGLFKFALAFIVFLIFIYALLNNKFISNTLQMSVIGISLLTAVLILLSDKNQEIKLLTLLGSLILLFEPWGSQSGILVTGCYSLWLLFPIVIDFLNKTNYISTKVKLFQDSYSKQIINIVINSGNLRKLKAFILSLCIIAGLYFSYYYPYFDPSDRKDMRFQVKNVLLKDIFTTKERSNVINEFVEGSKKFIKKNDVVFAYDNIPMINFITQTRPFMKNPWPGYYYPEAFQNELNQALYNSEDLPTVVRQKVNTLASKWPEVSKNELLKSKSECFRDSVFNHFLKEKDYHKVWENMAFEILIPENKIQKDKNSIETINSQ